jgi:hypothetical protein
VDPGEGDAEDGHGADGVEEDLEGAEEGLSEDGVEEDGLEGGGEIGVEAVDAEGLVVGEMVGAEGGRVGDADGEVGEDGEETVGKGGAEGEVVGDFVDGEEEVLVGGGAEDVGDGPELPVEEGRVAQGAGEEDLEGDDAEDDPFSQGLGAAELGDLEGGTLDLVKMEGEGRGVAHLGMGPDDGETPAAVRLLGVGPEELLVLDLEGVALLVGRQLDVIGAGSGRRRRRRLEGLALDRLEDCRGGRHVVCRGVVLAGGERSV